MHLLALFISVFLELLQDGSAVVTETWDIDCTSGTEQYLVRKNLGDIVLDGFTVSECGRTFVPDTPWNVHRSLEQKAGRCGIVDTGDGYELCWGIGSYGHHNFVVSYRMSNVVKSLADYDVLHLQTVSPGLNPVPDDVSVTVKAPVLLCEANAGIWGFGYRGSVNFTPDGCVRFGSDSNSFEGCSIISLIRFEKGIFESSSIQDRNFESLLEEALKGSDFEDDTFGAIMAAIVSTALLLLLIIAAILWHRKLVKDTLGCKEKEVGWCRDIPFEGDLLQSEMVLEILGENRKGSVAAAMILRMIHNSIIVVSKDERGNVELSFNDNAPVAFSDESERELYDMMKEASGSDTILQRNEFKRWSKGHSSKVLVWSQNLPLEGRRRAREASNLAGKKFTAQGQRNARNLVGLRNYLNDFTLLKERGSAEAVLWKEYMVFAALFGIADKVARELKEIDPQAFEQQMACDYDAMYQTIYITRIMADSITNARVAAQTAAAGGGGMSSFGGGRGFSGGGFGGGVR